MDLSKWLLAKSAESKFFSLEVVFVMDGKSAWDNLYGVYGGYVLAYLKAIFIRLQSRNDLLILCGTLQVWIFSLCCNTCQAVSRWVDVWSAQRRKPRPTPALLCFFLLALSCLSCLSSHTWTHRISNKSNYFIANSLVYQDTS